MTIINTLLSPNGRLSRIGFWGWCLAIAVVCATLWWLRTHYGTAVGLSPAEGVDPMWLVLGLPLLWIGFCLSVKRWHDRGKSGWWLMVVLVPVLGQVWALIECGFLAGQRGGNRFGPSPEGHRPMLDAYRLEDMPEDMP
ncbi:DUF805 domain-containing protein [Asticcacaulis excentricus]|uniref:DUF805 domain-containing protein n=1 Tax=Asticcacaulis excentricus (strain ATCC 15261 / DSM 4724 / KCTC 12464 / NCIMB 9791 / VKM B-1370 / CB 48) TaxID=573065 RepID=E8RSA6_ASTEC|nr:DUF805 domain-containing protein [Asticcacaulis excentricus]ADU14377.1 protein of unknown function DUF805 [Asticcacaulis excentricus CB 48]